MEKKVSELVFTNSPKKKKTYRNAPNKVLSRSISIGSGAKIETNQTLEIEVEPKKDQLPIIAQIRETVVNNAET